MTPADEPHPNAKDYEILASVYGYINGTSGSTSGRRTDRDLHLRSNNERSKHKFISFTDETHRHKWRMLEKRRGMELHELDLGDGYRMQARLMMADFF